MIPSVSGQPAFIVNGRQARFGQKKSKSGGEGSHRLVGKDSFEIARERRDAKIAASHFPEGQAGNAVLSSHSEDDISLYKKSRRLEGGEKSSKCAWLMRLFCIR